MPDEPSPTPTEDTAAEGSEPRTERGAPPAVEQKLLALLEWFVIRARRVEEHSLAADKKQLVAWASGTVTLSGVVGEPEMTMRWDLPPEEPLDSLAARCRPFLLDGDPVYWPNVRKGLAHFLHGQDADDLTNHLQQLQKEWNPLRKSTPGDLGYVSRAGRTSGDPGELVDSKTLAYAWLYGDLVHSDVPDQVGEHDIDDRYRAGAILITRAAVYAIKALNLVRAMQARGIIALSAEVFTQRVTADPNATLTTQRAIAGPVGASIEQLEAAMDAFTAPPTPG